jgi:hypothetical protein
MHYKNKNYGLFWLCFFFKNKNHIINEIYVILIDMYFFGNIITWFLILFGHRIKCWCSIIVLFSIFFFPILNVYTYLYPIGRALRWWWVSCDSLWWDMVGYSDFLWKLYCYYQMHIDSKYSFFYSEFSL